MAERRFDPIGALRTLVTHDVRFVVIGGYAAVLHGSALFTREGYFALPAYPTPDVIDPTGAGDTFAGGFMGYVAAHPDEEIDDSLLRRAMAYGTALASFNVEAFGPERILSLTGEEIAGRVAELHRSSSFDDAPIALR